MKKVNLNCDLGESFGNYVIGMDEQVIPYICSANVACGFHASDPVVMDKTVLLAAENKVEVGAHPGFPDLVGFGRRNMDIPADEVKRLVLYQIGALDAFCRVHNITMSHVKPHGALYNMAAKDKKLSAAICEGIYEYNPNLILLGLYQSEMITAAKQIGLSCVNEVFADRAYEEDGTLVSRKKQGAVITEEEEIVNRVLRMVKEGTVVAHNGVIIPIAAESICVHGDNPKAIELVKKIKEVLTKEGVVLSSMREVVGKEK